MNVKGKFNGGKSGNMVLAALNTVDLEEIQNLSSQQFTFFVNVLTQKAHADMREALDFLHHVRQWKAECDAWDRFMAEEERKAEEWDGVVRNVTKLGR